ncbi:MAG: Fe-S protein assembly co-chaperone HscB [Betaproteobacteria bacterium]|nr:Fe-S protein assembly co-chaperone HscB [Betaproteobacteria bacterium]
MLPRLTDNDFALFGLPERQALERSQLDARRRALQAEVHPDRFAAEGAAAQRLAMQWAMRINEAHVRLKDPLKRAAALCALRGVPIDAERNTAMPAAFLARQMQWREALDEAGEAADAIGAIRALDADVARDEQAGLERLQTLLDDTGDANAAAAEVRALMFVARFREDIARRLEALDAH